MVIMSEGLRLISAERVRQITEEGYSAAHDGDHADEEIAMAAACYAANEPIFVLRKFAHGFKFVDPWPWEDSDDRRKANGANFVNSLPLEAEARLRMLVKSGALIAAEIDRLTALKGNRAHSGSEESPATK